MHISYSFFELLLPAWCQKFMNWYRKCFNLVALIWHMTKVQCFCFGPIRDKQFLKMFTVFVNKKIVIATFESGLYNHCFWYFIPVCSIEYCGYSVQFSLESINFGSIMPHNCEYQTFHKYEGVQNRRIIRMKCGHHLCHICIRRYLMPLQPSIKYPMMAMSYRCQKYVRCMGFNWIFNVFFVTSF